MLIDFSAATAVSTSTRRHEPRFAVNGRLSIICLDSLTLDVRGLLDLSFGGFAIETSQRIVPGSQHSFEIRGRDGLVITAPARATSCQMTDRGSFRSGWEFVPLRDLDHAVERVLDTMPGPRAC